MRDNEAVFKQIAKSYVNTDGQKLREEQSRLAEKYPELSLPEARMEKRVMSAVKAKKRKPYYVGTITLLAACFAAAFIFIIPSLFNTDTMNESAAMQGAGGAADAPVISEDSTGDAAPDADPDIIYSEESMIQAESPDLPISQDNAAQDDAPAGSGEAQEERTQPQHAIILLNVTLPQGFTQTGFEQDKGKSIYYIEDEYLDNVVVTLEKTEEFLDTAGLVPITISGLTVYGTKTSTYNKITFYIDDVLHTMTSGHDINTLIRLATAFA